MDARIAAIRSRVAFRKLENPVATVVGPLGAHGYVAVEAFTADGRSGLGYVRSFELATVRAAHWILTHVGASLIGDSVSNTNAAWKKMWKRITLHGRCGVHAYGLAAIDTALWDLKAKLCDLPLYRLLGGARESVPSYYSGAFLSASDSDVVREAEMLDRHGSKVFKMRVGMPELSRDVERARLIKQSFRGDLMMDAAGAFDRGEAMRAAREFAAFSPVWFEDPVPTERIHDLQGLRSTSPVPFAGGELLYSEAEVTAFAGQNAYDHVLFDLQRIGGVTGWMRSAAIADQYGLHVSAHVFPEISAHLLCGLENGYFHESLDWSHELFANPPGIANGHARPSQDPGLGLKFDEDFIRKHLVEETVVGDASIIP